MIVDVACKTDSGGRLQPVRFTLGGRTIRVVEVIDRWPSGPHEYIKLRGDDGHTYILRYDAAVGHWELWMFEKGIWIGGPCS